MTGAFVTSSGEEHRGFHQSPNILRDVYMKKIGVDGYGFLQYLMSWANTNAQLPVRRMKQDLKVSQDKLERIQKQVLEHCGHFVTLTPGSPTTPNRWHLDMRQVWNENAIHMARGLLDRSVPESVPEIGTLPEKTEKSVPEIGAQRTGSRYTSVPEVGTIKDNSKYNSKNKQKPSTADAAGGEAPAQTQVEEGQAPHPTTSLEEPRQATLEAGEQSSTKALDTVPGAAAEPSEHQAMMTAIRAALYPGQTRVADKLEARIAGASKQLRSAGLNPEAPAGILNLIKAQHAWRKFVTPEHLVEHSAEWASLPATGGSQLARAETPSTRPVGRANTTEEATQRSVDTASSVLSHIRSRRAAR